MKHALRQLYKIPKAKKLLTVFKLSNWLSTNTRFKSTMAGNDPYNVNIIKGQHDIVS